MRFFIRHIICSISVKGVLVGRNQYRNGVNLNDVLNKINPQLMQLDLFFHQSDQINKSLGRNFCFFSDTDNFLSFLKNKKSSG